MKKLLLVLALVGVFSLPLVSETFTEFETGFDEFSKAIANSLPFNALIGQHWSDAYIGQFPHLGAGFTLGATTIPLETIQHALGIFNISLPESMAFMESFGLPLPAYSLEARLGVPFLPMDVGVKFGTLPEDAKGALPEDFQMDYLMAGLDARYSLLEENILMPAVSVGLGYTFLKGSLAINGLLDGDIPITDVAGHTLVLTNPDLAFQWGTSVLDIKAQVSKDLLFLTPYLGLGGAYGISSAGGGLEAKVQFDGADLTDEDIQLIEQALGDEAPDLSDQGIITESSVQGWAFHLYGGVALKLFILYTDLGIMYNISNQALGATVNLRIQL